MSRPIKSRTTSGYARDIERLNRLRTAIMMDNSIDSAKSQALSSKIDTLVIELVALAKKLAA